MRILTAALAATLGGCTITVYELGGPWDIAEQRLSDGTAVEGTGFMDLGDEARYYAWGVRYDPGAGQFVGYLDPPVLTESSVSSLDLDEAPVLILRYGDADVTFLAVADERDIVLQASDPWGAGLDLDVLLTRP